VAIQGPARVPRKSPQGFYGQKNLLVEPRDLRVWFGVLGGAAIGLLSGLTGTGGGIFLSALLPFLGWSATKPVTVRSE